MKIKKNIYLFLNFNFILSITLQRIQNQEMLFHINHHKNSAIISSLGAELVTFCKNETNYIWTVDNLFWNKTSPILFPIVGKLQNDTYSLNGKQYNLPRHGFARDFEFDLIEKKENSLIFSLIQNEETINLFPFDFELQIAYTLSDDKLEISYLVKNNSETTMPFSIGAHPAITINNEITEYSIEFENCQKLICHNLNNQLFDGTTNEISLNKYQLPLSYSLFEKDAIVIKNFECRNLIIFENGTPYLKFDLGNFPHLGIWTKQDAPFLCVEPWFGYADSHNTTGYFLKKEGIQILEPNKIFKSYFSIEILQ